MRIMNNTSAMLALGETNKNQKALEKQLKKVATGTKITGAGDGASEYSISEKMRVKLRALGQDVQNVQTGASMLHIAEGGIQQQVDILKTVKERVLAANNDTATDVDRQTIQKEINQSYDQMQDIATMTTYNNRRVLFGGTLSEQIFSWVIKDKAELVKDSDTMNLIPDKYATLDNQTGPFDIFKEYGSTSSSMTTLGLSASQDFTGGTTGTANTIVMGLGSYGSVAALDNVGFSIGGYSYVLTKDTSRNYQNIYGEIDISGCSTVAEVAAKIGAVSNSYVTATASGSDVTFTTTDKSSASNNTTVTGISRDAATITSGGSAGRVASPATGLFSSTTYLSGGSDQIGYSGNPDPDAKYVPGQAASLSANISSASSGSGITVSGGYYGTVYVQFVDGSSGLTKGSDGVYTLGKNASVSGFSLGNNMYLSLSNGVMTLTSEPSIGGYANTHFSVSDGIPAVAATSPTTITYTAVNSFIGSVDNKKTGTDGDKASYTIDLTGYNTSDSTALEALIKDMAGKAISYGGSTYEFIDSSKSPSMSSFKKLDSGTTIDLGSLRSVVTGTTTIATALSTLLSAYLVNSDVVKDTNGIVTGVKLSGSIGTKLTVLAGQLRSYDLDYGSWFAANNPSPVASALNGKGFRAYCATDNSQWFNFLFTDGTGINADKPKSGTATQDIKTILINVSQVTDAGSLVKAIYDQAEPILTGTDKSYNHHMRLAADTETGVLTLYDKRRYNVNTSAYDYQEKGAKIADGVLDNVIQDVRNVYADDLIIQHTDKANMNIHIKIPRTTLDQVFGYQTNEHDPSYYNVMTASMREQMLGKDPDKGVLDNGIDYLLSAITLVGAQTSHLEAAHANIVTQSENLTAVV